MKRIVLSLSVLILGACATKEGPGRKVASADVRTEFQIKNQVIKSTIVDRGWSTSTGTVEVKDGGSRGGFPTIEAVKSFLLIHEMDSAAGYNLLKVDSALKGTEQCQSLGATEKANTRNQVDGYLTTVTAKIVNNLEMPASFTLRYVCLVSVLAVKK